MFFSPLQTPGPHDAKALIQQSVRSNGSRGERWAGQGAFMDNVKGAISGVPAAVPGALGWAGGGAQGHGGFTNTNGRREFAREVLVLIRK